MENRLSQMEALLRAATQGTLRDRQSLGPSDARPTSSSSPSSSRELWPSNDSRRPSSTTVADVIEYVGSPTSPMQENPLECMFTSPCADMPALFPNPPSFDQTLEQQTRASVSSGVEVNPTCTISCPNSLQMPVSPPNSAINNESSARNPVPEVYLGIFHTFHGFLADACSAIRVLRQAFAANAELRRRTRRRLLVMIIHAPRTFLYALFLLLSGSPGNREFPTFSLVREGFQTLLITRSGFIRASVL